MAFLYKFQKPEYLFRPSQLVKRLFTKLSSKKELECKLPWGARMLVNPNEVVGKSIDRLGLYELATSELLLRLVKECDEFVDIGANIGYFTMVALAQKEFKGIIHSFEPHPTVFSRLEKNIKLQPESMRVILHHLALSTQEGNMTLYIPESFGDNEGIATLEKPEGRFSQIVVPVKRLDEVLSSDRSYILKIDTEGHEESVLNGAEGLFQNNSIKAVFFEEFNDPKIAKSFNLLKKHNFKIFRIERSLFGPKLNLPEKPFTSKQWEPVNYLAIKPELFQNSNLKSKGWTIL